MTETKLITKNSKAFHEYEILERFEAGIVLEGTEVKSLREGRANLKEAFARVKNEEVWLIQCHISPYSHGGYTNHDPVRRRKLLLHKREIRRLVGKVQEKGLALIPLSLYFLGARIKVELGLCRGKKLHDKRESAQERTERREIDRIIKEQRSRG